MKKVNISQNLPHNIMLHNVTRKIKDCSKNPKLSKNDIFEILVVLHVSGDVSFQSHILQKCPRAYIYATVTDSNKINKYINFCYSPNY